MCKIRVDIEDLMDRLNDLLEDDYVTAELEIEADKFSSELKVSAVSFEQDDPIPYGTVGESEGEL